MTEDEWRALHEKERQHNIRLMFQDLPSCRKCNDHGYVTIIFPKGYEAIRPCDCASAHKRFGENTFTEMNSRDEKTWWGDMAWYFGGKDRQETEEIMSQYKLEQLPCRSPRSEVVWKWVKK